MSEILPAWAVDIRERAAKATAGPWVRDENKNGHHSQSVSICVEIVPEYSREKPLATVQVSAWKIDKKSAVPNAEFIARAREDVPRLLEALSQALEELKRKEEQ